MVSFYKISMDMAFEFRIAVNICYADLLSRVISASIPYLKFHGGEQF